MESYNRFDEIFQEIETINQELSSNGDMSLQEMMEKARRLKELTREGSRILDQAKEEIQTIYLDLED
jgi:exonuclease VII small subunit